MTDAFDPQPTVINEPVPDHLLEGLDTRTRTTGATSAKASRRWSGGACGARSPGMLGLVLVCLLLFVSVFAYFFSPVDPKAQNVAFAPPDKISFYVADQGWRCCRSPSRPWRPTSSIPSPSSR